MPAWYSITRFKILFQTTLAICSFVSLLYTLVISNDLWWISPTSNVHLEELYSIPMPGSWYSRDNRGMGWPKTTLSDITNEPMVSLLSCWRQPKANPESVIFFISKSFTTSLKAHQGVTNTKGAVPVNTLWAKKGIW